MLDFAIDWERIKKCAYSDKLELLGYIKQLLALANDFNKLGIGCFTGYLKTHNDSFETVAINLVCEGYMPDIVSSILSNLIQASCLSDIQYFRKVLFALFILMSQKGTFSVADMKGILISCLGIEFADNILLIS